jgi:hypothetical protein
MTEPLDERPGLAALFYSARTMGIPGSIKIASVEWGVDTFRAND